MIDAYCLLFIFVFPFHNDLFPLCKCGFRDCLIFKVCQRSSVVCIKDLIVELENFAEVEKPWTSNSQYEIILILILAFFNSV
jgi:hypothetical protein